MESQDSRHRSQKVWSQEKVNGMGWRDLLYFLYALLSWVDARLSLMDNALIVILKDLSINTFPINNINNNSVKFSEKIMCEILRKS